MKLLKIIMAGLGVLAIASFYLSCTKINFERVADTNDDFYNQARLQIYNASINTQRTMLFSDGKRLSGAALIYTQTTATNAAHTGSGVTFLLPTGLHSFSLRDTLSTSAQPPINFSQNMEPNKFYTLFTYDTMNAIKQRTYETNLVIPSDSTARVRFANFIYLKSGVPPPMDIFSKRLNANIFSNISYLDVTEFIPYASQVSDSLIVRTAGTMIALDTTVLSFTPKRSYTLVLRGRYTTNEIGGALFPRILASYANN